METLFFTFYDTGDVATWGEEVPGGIQLVVPADWALYGPAKYVANNSRTGLVVRDGWTDPEPEA